MLIKNSSDIRCMNCGTETSNRVNGYPVCGDCQKKMVANTGISPEFKNTEE